eukprot:761663-Hanusia_phi.AAC.1
MAAFFKDINHAGIAREREDSDTVNSEASSSIVSDQSLADTLTPEDAAAGLSLRSSSDQCPASVDCYLDECRKYGIQPNPGVLVALRFQLRAMRPTAKFHCRDLMPLAEVLIKHGRACEHVKVADFSHARLQSHGAIVLSRILPHVKWERIEMQNNPIGGHGAKALASALSQCETVKHIGLRRCCIGTVGAAAIASELLEKDGNQSLSFLDLSTNHTGLQGVVRVKRSVLTRRRPVSIRMEGNIVLAEILSSATHGVGGEQAEQHAPGGSRGLRHQPRPPLHHLHALPQLLHALLHQVRLPHTGPMRHLPPHRRLLHSRPRRHPPRAAPLVTGPPLLHVDRLRVRPCPYLLQLRAVEGKHFAPPLPAHGLGRAHLHQGRLKDDAVGGLVVDGDRRRDIHRGRSFLRAGPRPLNKHAACTAPAPAPAPCSRPLRL